MTLDHGRSWIVLGTCVLINVVNVGVALSSGVYVAEMIDYYKKGKTAGYVVGALTYTLTYAVAPLASWLIEKTNHRTVLFLGSIISTTGLLLSANVPKLYWQYVTWSVTAIGCGFISQATFVVIPLYFKKYVSLASSLVVIGSATGILVYPIFALAIIKYYTWQPSLYIIAGLTLNICVGAVSIKSVAPSDVESPCLCPQHAGTKQLERYYSSMHAQENQHSQGITAQNENERLQITPKSDYMENIKDLKTEKNTSLNAIQNYCYNNGTIHDPSHNVESNNKVSDKEDKQTNCENNKSIHDDSDDFSSILLIDPDEPEIKMNTVIQDHTRYVSLKHNTTFWLYFLSMLLVCGSSSIPFVIGADIYKEVKLGNDEQSKLFLTFGLCNIFGRFISGFIIHFRVLSPLQVFLVCNMTWTLFLLPLIYPQEYINLIIYNVGFGLFYGGSLPAIPLTTLALVGVSQMNRAYGYLNITSVSSVIVTSIMGWFYDQTQTYTASVLMAVVISLSGCFLLIPPAFLWKQKLYITTSTLSVSKMNRKETAV